MPTTPKSSNLSRQLNRWIAVPLLCCLTGCTTLRTANGVGRVPLDSVVHLGDTVHLELRDGTAETFKVTTIEAAAVGDAAHMVPVSAIARLSIENSNVSKAFENVAGAVVVGGLLYYVVHKAQKVSFIGGL